MTAHPPEHPDDLDTVRTPAADSSSEADPADLVDQAEIVALPDDDASPASSQTSAPPPDAHIAAR